MSGIKRCAVAGALALGIGHSAHAADPRVYAPVEFIPGTPIYWNWSGFYAGGHWGQTSSNFKPDDATDSMIANLLRDTTIENEAGISSLPRLPEVSSSASNYGGFVGFNQQWEDIILSLEVNYNVASLSAKSTDSIGRSYQASDGYLYDVTLNSRAGVSLMDYGTARARAGYVMGRFLPYAYVGGALGRANINRSVSVVLTGTDPDPDPPVLPPVGLNANDRERKKNAFLYGVSAGIGLDVAITENIFLRGEYEYVHFFPFKGMTLDLHTGRIGAALKF